MTVFLVLASGAAMGQRTDVIYMKNGDRLTGEIKEMLLGEVYFETSSYGNIKVKWKDIRRIDSDKHIQFETVDGSRYFGTVDGDSQDGVVTVISAGRESELDFDRIVHFEQINRDQSFWDRLDKNLRLGFSYTQASDILRWNVATGLELREKKFKADVEFQSFVTNNSDGKDSRRANLGGGYTRYLRSRFLWSVSADVQTNDELGVDRRFLVKGGFGRYIWQTQATELSAAIGLAANWEASIGDVSNSSETVANMEGVVSLDWTYFRLGLPESRYAAKLEYFPGLTDTGRNRANLTFNFKQEFVEDLFWNMEFYGSYDSRPPSGAQSTTDYGVITSLEFEW
jgi:uncharacterized protein DUF481